MACINKVHYRSFLLVLIPLHCGMGRERIGLTRDKGQEAKRESGVATAGRLLTPCHPGTNPITVGTVMARLTNDAQNTLLAVSSVYTFERKHL